MSNENGNKMRFQTNLYTSSRETKTAVTASLDEITTTIALICSIMIKKRETPNTGSKPGENF